MTATKADIITKLKKEIFSLQGYNSAVNYNAVGGEYPIGKTLFQRILQPGAVHEFIYNATGEAAVTTGFITVVLDSLMQSGRASIWIGPKQDIFPPALQSFGIMPDKIIFIQLQKEKEILWAMEEALKCDSLAAVIGEVPHLSFTASRRLQLAVEQSKVTGFILRSNSDKVSTTACVTRWKISALPSELSGNMPGVGFPRWNVDLLKVKNGKTGSWQIEFRAGCFRHIYKEASILPMQKKKTG
ncbi:MAG: SulA-like leucine-rich domain-containing protein [Chitinophagaceae bacterium]